MKCKTAHTFYWRVSISKNQECLFMASDWTVNWPQEKNPWSMLKETRKRVKSRIKADRGTLFLYKSTNSLSSFHTEKRQAKRWRLFSTWNCPFLAGWLSCHRRRRRYPGSWPLSRAARFWGPSRPRRSSAGGVDGAGPVCSPLTLWQCWRCCWSGRAPCRQTADWFHPFWLKVLSAARSAVLLKNVWATVQRFACFCRIKALSEMRKVLGQGFRCCRVGLSD